MSISLFEAILPCAKIERDAIDCLQPFPKGGMDCSKIIKRNKNNFTRDLQKTLKLQKLFLTMAVETAEACCNRQYTKFDPLLKNYGCQISAFQIQILLQQKGIFEEAENILNTGKKCLENINRFIEKPPIGNELYKTRADFLQNLGLDLRITAETANLIRLRILSVVNVNKVTTNSAGEEREVPFTEPNCLVKKVRKIDEAIVRFLVSGLQSDESQKSISFLRERVEKNFPDSSKFLTENYVRTSQNIQSKNSPISSVPLMFNTEASLRCVEGIILIKNKLKTGNVENNEKNIKIFLKIPENKILSDEEVTTITNEEPLYVIEGYIQEENALKSCVESGELFNLIKAQTAALYQYAANTKQKIEDPELLAEIKKYEPDAQKSISIFEIDHYYCAAAGEMKQ